MESEDENKVVKSEDDKSEVVHTEVVMTSIRIEPPSFVSDRKSYDAYKRELTVWALATSVEKKKQALIIALSLPDTHDSNIKEKVFAEIEIEDLNSDDGMKNLIEFLDKRFLKDSFVVAYEKYQTWSSLTRKIDQKVEDFISDYESVCKEAENHGIKDFEVIKAFKLLDASNLEPIERQLVFTGIDFDSAKTKKDLFDQMKSAIKKFKGEQSRIIQGGSERIDAAFLSQNEEVLAAHGYKKFKGKGGSSQSKKKNPSNLHGEPYVCFNCGSIYHFIGKCPKMKDRKKVNHLTEDDESSLVTLHVDTEVCLLVGETANKAVLDSACTATVAGSEWVSRYVSGLSAVRKKLVKEYEGERTFKFGGGVRKKSLKKLCLPVYIAGMDLKVTTDVVDAEIPLLLSLQTMKKAKMIVNFAKDDVEIMGRKVKLSKTSTGHYSISLNESDIKRDGRHYSREEVYDNDGNGDDVADENALFLDMIDECLISIDTNDDNERYKALKKLHEQVAHLPIEELLKTSGKWKPDMGKMVKQVEDSCTTCKLYAKRPPKPVVALSRAKKFNEVLSLDLKFWRGKIILYLIDQWSRLTIGVFIKSKNPADVVNAIWTKWIAAGYGRPECIHSDKGGEFSNEEVGEMADQLGCKASTTAGYAPHQNGINERNHTVNDRCMDKIKEDYPDMDDELILAHALFAKNCLQMTYGYSSLQLVFGQNPNLPNNSDATPPMLEEPVDSHPLRNHLNVLHSARVAFMKCEADVKIKRSMKHNVRRFSKDVMIGDWVYFKRKDQRWKGPGEIIGKKGKIFLVDRGGLIYRVEGNVVVKVGEEFLPMCYQIDQKTAGTETEGKKLPDSKENEEKNEGNEELNVQSRVSEEVIPETEVNNNDEVRIEDVEPVQLRRKGDKKVILKKKEKIKFKETEDKGWEEGTVLQRAGKVTGKYDEHYNVQINNESKDIKVINMKDVVEWNKIDAFSTPEEETTWVVYVPKENLKDREVVEARMKQLNDWKVFDVYEEVDDCGQKRIKGGWIDVYKEVDKETIVKSRFVARGYMEEGYVQSDSPTVRKDNIRLTCMIAALNGWRLETKDYHSAFLQGTELDRELYMEPPPEEKKPGVIWRLKKAVYGLNDASRRWWEKCSAELEGLGCVRSLFDPALFLYFDTNGKLSGIICLHVDDKLGCGGSEDFMCKVWEKLDEKLVVGKTERDDEFRYVGLNIKQGKGITIDQIHYAERLELISEEEISDSAVSDDLDDTVNEIGQSIFRAKVGALNWLSTQTRPDIAYEVMEFSTCFNRATLRNLKEVNKCMRKVKMDQVYVKFPKLEGCTENWTIVTYGDGAFANLPDKVMSSGGHIILVVDEKGNSCPITWSVNKIQRVVRSSLASEALTQQEAIDGALFAKEMLREVFGKQVEKMKVVLVTDSKSLQDAIYSTSLVKDKMLRINIAAIKQAIERFNVHFHWKCGGEMIADALSKKHSNKEILRRAIMLGRVDV